MGLLYLYISTLVVSLHRLYNFTFMLPCIVIDFFLNNQPEH